MGAAVVDPLFLALESLRRQEFEECESRCLDVLRTHPTDKSAWHTRARCVTARVRLDDAEAEQESMADAMLDENATAAAPRPGTSLAGLPRPGTSLRPLTGSGRPVTGFVRPGTRASLRSRGGDTSGGLRPQTSRVMTAAGGRSVRLGTASLATGNQDSLIDVSRVDLAKYAARPALSRALCDFLIYHEGDFKTALDLCARATERAGFSDWWWKARIGKCYLRLGMLRDAERQFKSSLADESVVTTVLELVKVYIRLDQPKTAVVVLKKALEKHPDDVSLLLAMSRIEENPVQTHRRALEMDPTSAEALASLASELYYEGHPEHALRLYKRMAQIGAGTAGAELWCNIGLCCYAAMQLDLVIPSFERALSLAGTREEVADVWYNIASVAIGNGDAGLAYQCLRLAVTSDPNHADALNNLGVLELRRGETASAAASFAASRTAGPVLYEPAFNGAVLARNAGDVETTFRLLEAAEAAHPGHVETKEMMRKLKESLTVV